jgi:hypothetical protein
MFPAYTQENSFLFCLKFCSDQRIAWSDVGSAPGSIPSCQVAPWVREWRSPTRVRLFRRYAGSWCIHMVHILSVQYRVLYYHSRREPRWSLNRSSLPTLSRGCEQYLIFSNGGYSICVHLYGFMRGQHSNCVTQSNDARDCWTISSANVLRSKLSGCNEYSRGLVTRV